MAGRLRRGSRLPLLTDTLRAHRTGAVVWVVAGGLAMYGMALALATEFRDFPGGPEALAASILPSAEAMRPLRWPAERIDTLGGYLTWHNVMVLNLILAVYGAIQGAGAVRGAEDRRSLDEVLATGTSRGAVIRTRTLGFVLAMVPVSLGLGLATAAGMAGAGEPDLAGSMITMGISGLVAAAGFGLGLLVSQLTTSARAAGGASAVGLTALYVVTNTGEGLGVLSALRFVSPFHWANHSRALVPGHHLDLPATAALVALAATLVVLATLAFTRRDYAAPLWSRRPAAGAGPAVVRVPTALLRSVWTATLRRGRFGLAAWAAGAAVLTALMASLQPTVMEAWSAFDWLGAITGGGAGISVDVAYWGFAAEIVTPVVAAFVITQTSGWVADLAQGRVETLLAGPVSWTRLVVERLVALVVGVLVVTTVALGALVLVAGAVGGTLDAAGLGRVAGVSGLLGAALGGVAAIAVAGLRRGAAVTALAVVVGASYLVTFLAPMFGWPEWTNRLSVFWAFGHPYVEWPPASGLAVLAVLAVPGAALAAAIAERTAKVAG